MTLSITQPKKLLFVELTQSVNLIQINCFNTKDKIRFFMPTISKQPPFKLLRTCQSLLKKPLKLSLKMFKSLFVQAFKTINFKAILKYFNL